MNENDFDMELEAQVRAELRRTIVPPATPAHARETVERMAASAGRGTPIPISRVAPRFRSSSVVGLAAAAVIAVLVVGGLAFRAVTPVPGSSRSPEPHPTGTPVYSEPPGPTFRVPPFGLRTNVSIVAYSAGLAGEISVDGTGDVFTADGGVTWSDGSTFGLPLQVDFSSVDSYVSQGVGDELQGGLSYDGGRSWHVWQHGPTLPAHTADTWQLSAAASHFVDARHGVVVVTRLDFPGPVMLPTNTECMAFTTDDGAVTWSREASSPCLSRSDTTPIVWVSQTAGYILGGSGPDVVAVTLDGGRTWHTGTLPGIPSYLTVRGQLLLVDGPGQLRLVTSTDPIPTGDRRPLQVFHSSDSGDTWTEAYQLGTPPNASQALLSHTLFSFSALGPQHWRAVAEVAPTEAPIQTEFVETFDGGLTWSVMPSSGITQAAEAIWWDDSHGMAQGMYMDCRSGATACSSIGTVFVTRDGGRTWHQVPF